MDFDFELLRVGFSEQGAIFVGLVDDTADLATLTALGDWDCAVLIGHVNTAVEALWRWQGEVPNGAPEIDASGWWDFVDAGTNDSFSKRYAAKRSDDELRELIRSSVTRVADMLATTAPEQTLVAHGGLAWTRSTKGWRHESLNSPFTALTSRRPPGPRHRCLRARWRWSGAFLMSGSSARARQTSTTTPAGLQQQRAEHHIQTPDSPCCRRRALGAADQ